MNTTPEEARIASAAVMLAVERTYLSEHPQHRHWSRRTLDKHLSPERLFVWARQRWGIHLMTEVAQHVTVEESDIRQARRVLLAPADGWFVAGGRRR